MPPRISLYVSPQNCAQLPGLDQLRKAGTLLMGDMNGRAPLHAAAEQVWAAMFYSDRWPPELQKGATALQPLLFKYGTIRMTVAGMSDEELVQLRQRLRAFLVQAEGMAR